MYIKNVHQHILSACHYCEALHPAAQWKQFKNLMEDHSDLMEPNESAPNGPDTTNEFFAITALSVWIE